MSILILPDRGKVHKRTRDVIEPYAEGRKEQETYDNPL